MLHRGALSDSFGYSITQRYRDVRCTEVLLSDYTEERKKCYTEERYQAKDTKMIQSDSVLC